MSKENAAESALHLPAHVPYHSKGLTRAPLTEGSAVDDPSDDFEQVCMLTLRPCACI